LLVLAMFIFTSFIASRWLPASANAPQVNQKAPEFTLKDTSNKAVSLSALLSEPINGKPPRGVLLVYYRGYW
jgi:peroxiredoxin